MGSKLLVFGISIQFGEVWGRKKCEFLKNKHNLNDVKPQENLKR